jgi:hypothetical protein
MSVLAPTATDILSLGDDQMSSQMAIVFTDGIPGGGDTDKITLRLDQSFDPPEDLVETYDVILRGIKIPHTSMTHAMDKQFQVAVRIDQNWEVIKGLETWYYYCYNPQNATALPDAQTRTNVSIQYFNGQGTKVKEYRIKGLKIKGYKIETSDPSSPDPLRATISFIFADWVPDNQA